MNYNILNYLIYLPLAIALAIWVGQTLFKKGRVFLMTIFHGDQELVDSVNHLLIVGFYLLNFGYAIYTMKVIQPIPTMQVMIEALSLKIGRILLILGALHLLNLTVLFILRRNELEIAPNNNYLTKFKIL
ncbi:MAG: hypothetical protein R8G66_08275 [Cytophagales bacterium]|nr:hypothetical protein [Cytophagales bacterium]